MGLKIGSFTKKVKNVTEELVRIENLEKNLAKHEIMLVKKIRDLNALEEKVDNRAHREELQNIGRKIEQLSANEEILFENSKALRQISKQISEAKTPSNAVTRNEFDKRLKELENSLSKIEESRFLHRQKAGRQEFQKLKDEVHDRMSQIEYQHKLLISFFRKVDDRLERLEKD